MSMLTSDRARRRAAASCSLALLVLLAAAPVRALDGSETPATSNALQLFKDPQSAMQAGMQHFRAGDVKLSVEALQYAADQGYHPAQWKLGEMYSRGDGVPRDDVRAYDYFSQIVASYKEDEEPSPQRRFILSNAFVAVGTYNLEGIPNKLPANPERALRVFEFAATNFSDPTAEYYLGKMYLEGIGTSQNGRQGVGWLDLAARKNFIWAQAYLGQKMFTGAAGVTIQRGRGLALLMIANEQADKVKDAWVCNLFAQAWANATDADRQSATLNAIEYRILTHTHQQAAR
jgi:uncharacterized protein